MTAWLLPKTIEWVGDLNGCVRLIDQTRLPTELVFLECHDVDTMHEAIRTLRIRGAPAIGIAAAMGAVLGIRDFTGPDRDGFRRRLEEVCTRLATARPTAVNLCWALDRMRTCVAKAGDASVDELKRSLLDEAKTIRDQDAEMCRAIGRHGQPLIRPGFGVLTHCNAGSLATSELGTALAPLYLAHQNGVRFDVYVTETRPLLQGSRLTAWELQQAGINVTLLCDSMAGSLMHSRKIDLVITGADRIAVNGDVANKIGTYSLAVLAQAHDIPFYVAAPTSTFDRSLQDGSAIPIESRDPDEIRAGFGRPTAPPGVRCFTPAFDVTPATLLTGLITDRGLIRPVSARGIAEILPNQSDMDPNVCPDSRQP
jgi:methylthioribose-1-phosphate isomerase